MKTIILEIPAVVYTELTQEMVKRGIEITTVEINDENEMVVKATYDEQNENNMDAFKALLHLLKFCKIAGRMKQREDAKAA